MLAGLKALVPQPLKRIGRALFPRKPYSCPVCSARLPRFERLDEYWFKNLDQYQYVHSIFAAETANVFHYSCGQCGASDRDRLYALYLKERLARAGLRTRFAEFAPTAPLTRLIKSFPGVEYRSGDLYEAADDQVDLTKLPYSDGSFDVFLCSHMLEHIEDDRQAMRELHRILTPGGWGIAMVPIQLDLETTLEGLSLETDGERWKYYGQNDHVRMYAKKDFVQRLQESGFYVRQFDQNYFGEALFSLHGIHSRSVLYIVEKPRVVAELNAT